MFGWLRCLWVWFRQLWGAKAPAPPTSSRSRPELSNADCEQIFFELLGRVQVSASWGSIQGFLITKDVTSERMVRWLEQAGQVWCAQPDAYQEIGQSLARLSQVAQGPLGHVSRRLSESILPPPPAPPASLVIEADFDDATAGLAVPWSAARSEDATAMAVEAAISDQLSIEVPEPEIQEIPVQPVAVSSGGTAMAHSEGEFAVLEVLETQIAQPVDASSTVSDAPTSPGEEPVEPFIEDEIAEAATPGSEELEVEFVTIEAETQPEIAETSDGEQSADASELDAFYEQGIQLCQAADYADAIACFDQVLIRQPEAAEAWRLRGLALADLRSYEEAIASYDQALALKPDFAEAWLNRSVAVRKSYNHDPFIQREFVSLFDEECAVNDITVPVDCRHFVQICASQQFSLQDDSLNQRGKAGELATLNFPVQRSLLKSETDPVSWGKLYHQLGRLQDRASLRLENAESTLQAAQNSYEQALAVLGTEEYAQQRLAILLDDISLLFHQEAELVKIEAQLKAGTVLAQQLFPQNPALFPQVLDLQRHIVDYFLLTRSHRKALWQADADKTICLRSLLTGDPPDPQTFTDATNRAADQTPWRFLDEQTAAVYWYLSPNSLNAFLLLPGQTHPVLVRDRNCWQQLQDWEAWLTSWNQSYHDYSVLIDSEELESHPWREDLLRNCEKLYSILKVADIQAQLPKTIERLILIPHRDLHRLPLHGAFPDYACVYLPALPPKDAVTVAPTLERCLLSTTAGSAISNLPYAEIEVALLSDLFAERAETFTDSLKTAGLTSALKQGFQGLHFCGYSDYDPDNPSQSSLFLDADRGLTSKEIYQLDLSSYELISLGTCETAIEESDAIADDYVGLASAFLSAGASQILTPLWTVESEANTLFVLEFYRQILEEQVLPMAALKNTQRWLQNQTQASLVAWCDRALEILPERLKAEARLSREYFANELAPGARPFTHPYYWLGFTLTGL